MKHRITYKNNTWSHTSRVPVLLFSDGTFTAYRGKFPLHAYVPHPNTQNHSTWMVPPESVGMQFLSYIPLLLCLYSLHHSVSTRIQCVMWCSCVKALIHALHSFLSPFWNEYYHHHHHHYHFIWLPRTSVSHLKLMYCRTAHHAVLSWHMQWFLPTITCTECSQVWIQFIAIYFQTPSSKTEQSFMYPTL